MCVSTYHLSLIVKYNCLSVNIKQELLPLTIIHLEFHQSVRKGELSHDQNYAFTGNKKDVNSNSYPKFLNKKLVQKKM